MRDLSLGILILLTQNAWACGYCVEDKIASTYDHEVVTRSLAQRHHVVFFHIDGPVSPEEGTRRVLQEAASAIAGVDKGSVRVSADALTVSLSFDPGRVSLVAINARLDRRLSARKLSFMPLRVMEEPADLRMVKR